MRLFKVRKFPLLCPVVFITLITVSHTAEQLSYAHIQFRSVALTEQRGRTY
jgi:hypothetical protein